MSGVLHCVSTTVQSNGFLPVAYYSEPTITITSVNSLQNIRQNPFSYGEDGLTNLSAYPFTIVTESVRVVKDASSVRVTSLQTNHPPYVNCDMKITQLMVTDGPLEPISKYNEVDSDVVLTTGTPTIWDRPQPTGPDVVLRSNVLDLIYAALCAEPNNLGKYVILKNDNDRAKVPDSNPSETLFLDECSYDQSTGKYTFSSAKTVTKKNVDAIIAGIADNMLQRNDKLELTVNGMDQFANQVYTTTLVCSGSASEGAYPCALFAGLLEKTPSAYANKQAICIAISKYNTGMGLDTTSFPPFQFGYKRSDQLKILDRVTLDFLNYYYIVYQFAPALRVTPLRLFSRPTANGTILKDVFVLSDKNDAYVDLEFPVSDKETYGFLTGGGVVPSQLFAALSVAFTPKCEMKIRFGDGAGRGRFQFFTNESDLYNGRTDERLGPKMRVYLGKVPALTTNIQIDAVFNGSTKWSVTIPRTNIRQYTDTTLNKGLVELQYPHRTDIGNRENFNDDISQWDIQATPPSSSGSKSLSGLLEGLLVFNQPIGCWNTAGIDNMSAMFKDSSAFNQPIGAWDTSAVTNMQRMFQKASSFDQSLDKWDVRCVSAFDRMFENARSFDGALSNWQTKQSCGAPTADCMFKNAASFNKPFHGQNFQVSACDSMFCGASSFNQEWCSILTKDCPSPDQIPL